MDRARRLVHRSGGSRDLAATDTIFEGRGLGIPLMQRVVETVLIHYDPGDTRLMLRHRLPGNAMPAPDADTPPLTPGLE